MTSYGLIFFFDVSIQDPKEAHGKFVARVNDFKQRTKLYEDKVNIQSLLSSAYYLFYFCSMSLILPTQVVQLRDDIAAAKKSLEELESAGGSGALGGEGDESEQAKYELLVKRDQDMTAFMEAFPETRNGTSLLIAGILFAFYTINRSVFSTLSTFIPLANGCCRALIIFATIKVFWRSSSLRNLLSSLCWNTSVKALMTAPTCHPRRCTWRWSPPCHSSRRIWLLPNVPWY